MRSLKLGYGQAWLQATVIGRVSSAVQLAFYGSLIFIWDLSGLSHIEPEVNNGCDARRPFPLPPSRCDRCMAGLGAHQLTNLTRLLANADRFTPTKGSCGAAS